jgi:hypothetical protein
MKKIRAAVELEQIHAYVDAILEAGQGGDLAQVSAAVADLCGFVFFVAGQTGVIDVEKALEDLRAIPNFVKMGEYFKSLSHAHGGLFAFLEGIDPQFLPV